MVGVERHYQASFNADETHGEKPGLGGGASAVST